MEAKYQAQEDYINHLITHITTEREKMQIKSEGCAQMAQSKMSGSLALADKEYGLAQLAKLYDMIVNLLDELEDRVCKRWKTASLKSFNARMSTLEDLRATYDDVWEIKRRGVEAVAKNANIHTERLEKASKRRRDSQD